MLRLDCRSSDAHKNQGNKRTRDTNEQHVLSCIQLHLCATTCDRQRKDLLHCRQRMLGPLCTNLCCFKAWADLPEYAHCVQENVAPPCTVIKCSFKSCLRKYFLAHLSHLKEGRVSCSTMCLASTYRCWKTAEHRGQTRFLGHMHSFMYVSARLQLEPSNTVCIAASVHPMFLFHMMLDCCSCWLNAFRDFAYLAGEHCLHTDIGTRLCVSDVLAYHFWIQSSWDGPAHSMHKQFVRAEYTTRVFLWPWEPLHRRCVAGEHKTRFASRHRHFFNWHSNCAPIVRTPKLTLWKQRRFWRLFSLLTTKHSSWLLKTVWQTLNSNLDLLPQLGITLRQWQTHQNNGALLHSCICRGASPTLGYEHTDAASQGKSSSFSLSTWEHTCICPTTTSTASLSSKVNMTKLSPTAANSSAT